jgi:amidase
LDYDEYSRHDAVGLAELVDRAEVTPQELLDVALKRADSVDPDLHAIVHRLDARARAQAAERLPEGPFRGVPFLVKDWDGTLRGAPYNAGSRALQGYVAPHDSELFLRYQRAGLVIFGKTNTPEFGLLGVTEPMLHGPTRNPWNLEHTPGGSSGGSAAAVAAGIVPAAHGGDGGGSLRIPASACGIFGFKPSRGRMPLGPDVGEGWHGLVVPHALTRSVRDSAALLDATHGPDLGAPYAAPPGPPAPGGFRGEVGRDPGRLRIAYSTRSLLGERTHPDCVRAVEDAMRVCASLGHEVTEGEPRIDRDAVRLAYLTIVAAGAAAAVEQTRALTGRAPKANAFEPTTWFLAQVGRALSALHLERARECIFRTTREVASFFERHDVFASSTLAYPPVRVAELAPGTRERLVLATLRVVSTSSLLERALQELAQDALEKTPNTMLFNMTGQPAMSVPLAWNQAGLPIGTQFVGRFGAEATLFRLGGQLEAALPWWDRRPAL